MNETLLEKVLKTLTTVSKAKTLAEIKPDTQLRDDLGLDSMSSLTFLMLLEENIEGFIVDPETLELTDLETVESITMYVMKQIQEPMK